MARQRRAPDGTSPPVAEMLDVLTYVAEADITPKLQTCSNLMQDFPEAILGDDFSPRQRAELIRLALVEAAKKAYAEFSKNQHDATAREILAGSALIGLITDTLDSYNEEPVGNKNPRKSSRPRRAEIAATWHYAIAATSRNFEKYEMVCLENLHDKLMKILRDEDAVLRIAHRAGLARQIEKSTTASEPTKNPQSTKIFSLVPHPAFSFVSSYIKREQLHRQFSRVYNQGGGRIALVGEPGDGKTRLALEILAEYASSWSDVAIIRMDVLRADLESELDIRAIKRTGPAAGELKSVFRQLLAGRESPRLVLIDNIESASDLNELVPHRAQGTVVITVPSTAPEDFVPDVGARVIEVGSLEEDEAISLAKSLLPELDDEQARSIASACDNRALVIEQVVGGLLVDSILTVDEVCKGLERETATILTAASWSQIKALPWAYGKIAQSLAKSSPDSGELMNLISMLGPDDIPVELLLETMKYRHQADYQRVALQAGLRLLRQKRLIRIDPAGINAHQLTRNIWREQCIAEEVQLCLDLHRAVRDLHSDEFGRFSGELLPLAWGRHAFHVLTPLGAVTPAQLVEHSIFNTFGALIKTVYRFGGFNGMGPYLSAFLQLRAQIEPARLGLDNKSEWPIILNDLTGHYDLLRAVFLSYDVDCPPIVFIRLISVIDRLAQAAGDPDLAIQYVGDGFELLMLQQSDLGLLSEIAGSWFSANCYAEDLGLEASALMSYVTGWVHLTEGRYGEANTVLTAALHWYARYWKDVEENPRAIVRCHVYLRILYCLVTNCWRRRFDVSDAMVTVNSLFDFVNDRFDEGPGDLSILLYLRIISVRITALSAGEMIKSATRKPDEKQELYAAYEEMLGRIRECVTSVEEIAEAIGHQRWLPRVQTDLLVTEPACMVEDRILPAHLCVDDSMFEGLDDQLKSAFDMARRFGDRESMLRLLDRGCRNYLWRGVVARRPISLLEARHAYSAAVDLGNPYLYAESLAVATIAARLEGKKYDSWAKEVEQTYRMLDRIDRSDDFRSALECAEAEVREPLYRFLFSS